MLKIKHADYLGEGVEWVIEHDNDNSSSIVGEFLVLIENDDQLHTALCEFNMFNQSWELKELVLLQEEEMAVLCDHPHIMSQIEQHLKETLPLKTHLAVLEMEEFLRKTS